MIIKKTISSLFLVPSLHIPRNALKDNGFVNGFIKDETRDEQYQNVVYVLFKPENLDKFREFLDDEYERTDQIIEDYDFDKDHIVVVYTLNKKFLLDFALIRKSKYSKTSENFQKLFPKVIKIIKNGLHRDELSLQYRIFNKTLDMIEYWEKKIGIEWNDTLEVWPGFDETKETLTINSI